MVQHWLPDNPYLPLQLVKDGTVSWDKGGGGDRPCQLSQDCSHQALRSLGRLCILGGVVDVTIRSKFRNKSTGTHRASSNRATKGPMKSTSQMFNFLRTSPPTKKTLRFNKRRVPCDVDTNAIFILRDVKHQIQSAFARNNAHQQVR